MPQYQATTFMPYIVQDSDKPLTDWPGIDVQLQKSDYLNTSHNFVPHIVRYRSKAFECFSARR
jgi:hypothetical protein